MTAIFRHPLHLLVLAFLVGSCASHVPVPSIPTVDSRSGFANTEDAAVERLAGASLRHSQDALELSAKTKFHANTGEGGIGKAWLNARDELKRRGFPPSIHGAFVVGGAPQTSG